MVLGTDLKLNIIYIQVVRVQICVLNSFFGILWWNNLLQSSSRQVTFACSCWCCLNWWWFRNVLGFSLQQSTIHMLRPVPAVCIRVVGLMVLGSRLVIALGAWKWLPTPFQSVCLWMLIKSVFALEKFSTGLTFNLLSQLHPVDGCHVPFQGCNSHLFIAHFTISTWNFSLWKCWIQGWGWWV